MVEQSQYATTTKYIVKAHFDVQGVVEKPDVVGAVFGQTEGLFGPDLDLRELQKSGRIGRIEINLDSKRDKTTGSIVIPSSLDKVSTAIIAAAIESVDRIGPCEAKITLEKVEDVREEKRNAILTKAKDILRKWVVESSPSTEEVVKEVASSLRGVDLIGEIDLLLSESQTTFRRVTPTLDEQLRDILRVLHHALREGLFVWLSRA